jgi:hypothetical protein
VGPGQQAPATGAPVAAIIAEGPLPQHREDTIALVVADQRRGQRDALHAVPAGRPERNQRVQGQPGDRPRPPGAGHDGGQLRSLRGRQEDRQVGVGHDDPAPGREAVQHGGQRGHDVARDEPRRVPPGHVDRAGQPGQPGCLRRRARLQPGPRRRVPRIQGAAVDPDPPGDRRQDRARGQPGAADVAAQAHGGVRRPGGVTGHDVAVPVQVQSQPGPGAQVGQADRVGAREGGRGDAQRDLRAPGHLVHLVAAPLAFRHDVVQPGRDERPGGPGEAVIERGLRPSRLGEIGRQRFRPVPADQVGDGRAGQQGGQPVGWQRGQPAEQFPVGGDGLEQAGGQPPGRWRSAG